MNSYAGRAPPREPAVPDRRLRPAAVLAGLAAGAAVLVACASTGEPVQNSATEVRAIPPGGLTQTFEPRGDRLARFTVWTATYGQPAADTTLHLDLVGAGLRRSVHLTGPGDNARATFAFEPVAGSARQRFAATITAAGPDRVGLYANPHDPYPEGALLPGGGDLTFEVGHAGRVRGAVAALGRVGREAAVRLGADPAFALVWLAALGAAGAAGVAAGRGARGRSG